MKILRLYTGNDHKSHFEEIEMKFGGNQPMLADDTSGEGHISRVLGGEPHIFMTVRLSD